jgi:type IV secretion system protein VirB1
MSVAALALAQLLNQCAPAVGPRTMSSIIAVESSGNPLAIHDNDDGRSYQPASRAAAVALASGLIARGHSVDLGLAQINSANVERLGLTVSDAFDACTNVRTGAEILAADYARATARYGPGQLALRRAIGAYNTGQLTEGDGCISAVVGAAKRITSDPSVVAELSARVPLLARKSVPAQGQKTVPARRVRILLAPAKKAEPAASLAADAPILVPLSPAGPPSRPAAGAAIN